MGKILIVLALCGAFSQALAQGVCGPRADIVKRLAQKYQERISAEGIAADGSIVEIFSAKSGTWTMTRRHPGGPTCLVATGYDWRRINDKGDSI